MKKKILNSIFVSIILSVIFTAILFSAGAQETEDIQDEAEQAKMDFEESMKAAGITGLKEGDAVISGGIITITGGNAVIETKEGSAVVLDGAAIDVGARAYSGIVQVTSGTIKTKKGSVRITGSGTVEIEKGIIKNLKNVQIDPTSDLKDVSLTGVKMNIDDNPYVINGNNVNYNSNKHELTSDEIVAIAKSGKTAEIVPSPGTSIQINMQEQLLISGNTELSINGREFETGGKVQVGIDDEEFRLLPNGAGNAPSRLINKNEARAFDAVEYNSVRSDGPLLVTTGECGKNANCIRIDEEEKLLDVRSADGMISMKTSEASSQIYSNIHIDISSQKALFALDSGGKAISEFRYGGAVNEKIMFTTDFRLKKGFQKGTLALDRDKSQLCIKDICKEPSSVINRLTIAQYQERLDKLQKIGDSVYAFAADLVNNPNKLVVSEWGGKGEYVYFDDPYSREQYCPGSAEKICMMPAAEFAKINFDEYFTIESFCKGSNKRCNRASIYVLDCIGLLQRSLKAATGEAKWVGGYYSNPSELHQGLQQNGFTSEYHTIKGRMIPPEIRNNPNIRIKTYTSANEYLKGISETPQGSLGQYYLIQGKPAHAFVKGTGDKTIEAHIGVSSANKAIAEEPQLKNAVKSKRYSGILITSPSQGYQYLNSGKISASQAELVTDPES